MMTLTTYKEILENLNEWLKRMAKNHTYSLDHLKGVVDGSYRMLLAFSNQIEYPEIQKDVECLEKDLIGYIEVFDIRYPIYLDDCGQSFYTKINEQEYSFGTYNTDIVPELISLVISNYINTMFKTIEEIYSNDKM